MAMQQHIHVRVREMDGVVPRRFHYKPVLCIHEFYSTAQRLVLILT